MYAIGEFAALLGLGIHTLRYYEKEGLICPRRSANGRRCYSEADVQWLLFVKRLKATGMPIREIRRYADLRAAGDASLEERLEMLLAHRAALGGEIARLQAHMGKLDEKIGIYRRAMARRTTEGGEKDE